MARDCPIWLHRVSRYEYTAVGAQIPQNLKVYLDLTTDIDGKL